MALAPHARSRRSTSAIHRLRLTAAQLALAGAALPQGASAPQAATPTSRHDLAAGRDLDDAESDPGTDRGDRDDRVGSQQHHAAEAGAWEARWREALAVLLKGGNPVLAGR